MTLKFGDAHRHQLQRHLPGGHDRTESRQRRDLHLQPRAGGRLLQQRSLDRRQRRHRHKDIQQSHRQSARRTELHDRKAPAHQRRRQLQLLRQDRRTGPDGRIRDRRQEHRQRAAEIRRPQRRQLRRHHPVRRDRTRRRQRRALHLHPRARRGRHLHQRSLDRRQRRHRHQDLQQSHGHRQRRTLLHDRKGTEDRRRSHLHHGEVTGKLGQTVEYKIIVKNTGNVHAQIRRPQRQPTAKASPRPAPPNSPPAKKRPSPAPTCSRSAPTPTKPRSKATKAPAPDVQQSHGQSRRRTHLHHRKAAADRRRRHLHVRRTHRQTRPDRRIQDHRPQHRQRGAQIRRPERHRLHGLAPTGATELPPTRAPPPKSSSPARTRSARSAPTPTKPRSKATKAPAPRPPTKRPTKVNAEPSFAIEKQQRVNGEGTFGVSEASGKLGQTVEYKVIVKNTGNVTLKFSALKDTGCEGI